MVRNATRALVDSVEYRQRRAATIKGCDEAVGESQAYASDCFISARANHNSLVATHHTTAAAKPAEKFHIFHQRHLWEPANINKCSSPTEHSMIAASHSKQQACIMRESVRQPIYWVWWQANAEIAAGNGAVIQYARNFSQAFLGHFGIYVNEPKNVAARGACAEVHLRGPIALAHYDLVAKPSRKIRRSIGASAIRDNNFGARRSLAKMLKKRAYQLCLIVDWNNNGELHSKLGTPNCFHDASV
jgi:hypothetical protein